MTEKQYKSMVAEHGEEALAESYVFPVRLTAKQKKESDMELAEALRQRREAMSSEDKVKTKLLQLKFQIEDYIRDSQFDQARTFSYYLKSYIDMLGMKQNELAREIDIKPAVLSQYLNKHRTPPENVMVRLELHSHNLISATAWYQLVEKEKVHALSANRALRREQRQYVAAKPIWVSKYKKH